ncbi:LutC/YkgG family protein [Streptomyces viridochromogenes]|nr:LUD domain-containing protein [Streptomyces viridochromogenes]
MEAREEILQRVRTALSDVPPDEKPEDVPVPRDYARSRQVDVVGLFAERVADYDATVHFVDPRDVPEALAVALAGARQVAVPADLPDSWLTALATETAVLRDSSDVPVSDLHEVDAVVTGAAVGIAETGTIVLDASARQGRRVLSLLPHLHVCVISSDQLVGTVPEAVSRLDLTRACTWISGPSATSDIELARVEGVHGPRTLQVLVVRERPAASAVQRAKRHDE